MSSATYLFENYTFIIVDEQTKEVFSGTLEIDINGNYTSGDLSIEPIEGHFYTIELFAGEDVAYRGKMYCTNQTPADKYTTQSGTYNALAGETSYKTI